MATAKGSHTVAFITPCASWEEIAVKKPFAASPGKMLVGL